MKVIKMTPNEVRIYPDGIVTEVYTDTERLVTDPQLKGRYKDMLKDKNGKGKLMWEIK